MLHYLMERERQAELVRRAERARQARGGWQPDRPAANGSADPNSAAAITLRMAGSADATALADLAGLDSAAIPAAPILLAEAGGELRAAVSLLDGAIIADPFHHTLSARELLRKRAAQLRGEPARAWPWRLLGRGARKRRPLPTNPNAAICGTATSHQR